MVTATGWVASLPSPLKSAGIGGLTLLPEIYSLALILCFSVAKCSVCPTFHHENHLEVFVLKMQNPGPAKSDS